ncbi:MAG: apolipoprotein N-acyltransferase, partial [Pseudomonadota bacterium]
MADLTPWRRRLIAAACGLALAAGAAPFSIIWFLFLAVPMLGWMLLQCTTARMGFGIGWWAGVTYFGGSMYWIVEPFFVDAARHAWMAPFALVAVATGMALFWGVAFGLAARFRGQSRILAMVAFWVLAEFVRGFIFTGFPWGMLSYGWSQTPVFQNLSWVGPYGLTFVTLLIAAFPLLMNRRLGVALTLLSITGLWIAGQTRMAEVPETETIVRLVQPNAPQHLKWDADWVRVFYDRAVAATEAEDPPTVVVWPETSVPFIWGANPSAEARMIRAARGAHLIAGHRKFDENTVLNSLLHLDGTGALVADYDKHHLVPFGEFVPLGDLAGRLGIHGLAAND